MLKKCKLSLPFSYFNSSSSFTTSTLGTDTSPTVTSGRPSSLRARRTSVPERTGTSETPVSRTRSRPQRTPSHWTSSQPVHTAPALATPSWATLILHTLFSDSFDRLGLCPGWHHRVRVQDLFDRFFFLRQYFTLGLFLRTLLVPFYVFAALWRVATVVS